MQRNVLNASLLAAIACAAGCPTSAHAVFLNPQGLGELLVYPYYTVNGGNTTVVTILNTTAQGKAVKVRFLEAYNGRDVLDFNLYLSPHDWWAGSIVSSGAGAGLLTNDNSCTVPPLPRQTPLVFSTLAFDGGTTQGKDGGPTDASRTLEGYVEVIEMGTVINSAQNTLAAITHSSGIPAACNQLTAAWANGGYWAANSSVDIGPPTGGLSGTGTLINVALGTVEGYSADAVAQFYPAATAGAHTAPDSLTPNIASGTSLTSLVLAAAPGSSATRPVTSTFASGLDAVSSVFMADSLYNEYWTGSGLAAASEWVITSPTKPFYTDPFYVGSDARPPFDVAFSSGTSQSFWTWRVYDREELPQNVCSYGVCPSDFATNGRYVAQVMTLNQPSVVPGVRTAVLASMLGTNKTTPANNGWALLDLADASTSHYLTSSAEGHRFEGQPVTGFWVTQFVNGNLGGVLANYSALYQHRAHRRCEIGQLGQSCS